MNIQKKIADLRVVFNNLVDLIEADLKEQDKIQNEHIRKYKEHPFGNQKEESETTVFTSITMLRLKKLIDLITETSNKKKVIPNENEIIINEIIHSNFLGGAFY